MKLKEVFYAFGLKPGVKEYTFEIETVVFEELAIEFAVWQHPRCKNYRPKPKPGALKAIQAYLRPGDAAIDVGAHDGDSTLPMALATGPTGVAFALEPNRYIYKVLLANSGLNRRLGNLIALNFAATPEDKEYEFEYNDPSFCNGGFHEGIDAWRHSCFFKLRVQGQRVVEWLRAHYPEALPKVRFVKIDTEGFDRSVFRTMQSLFETNRPFLKSEIYRHLPEAERRGYWRDLTDLGYTVRKFVDEERYEGEILAEADMTKWPHFDIFAIPR